jgi:hypothetical protein
VSSLIQIYLFVSINIISPIVLCLSLSLSLSLYIYIYIYIYIYLYGTATLIGRLNMWSKHMLPRRSKKSGKCMVGPGVGSNAEGPSPMRELAARVVWCVAWQVRQVRQPGGLDRGVGGWLAGLIGQGYPGHASTAAGASDFGQLRGWSARLTNKFACCQSVSNDVCLYF